MRTSSISLVAVVSMVTLAGTLPGQATTTPPEPVNIKLQMGVATKVSPQDGQNTDYLLRFQLIAAGNFKGSDPATSSVDSVLRDLFKFTGYREITQSAVAVSTAHIPNRPTDPMYGSARLLMSGPSESYTLQVTVVADPATRMSPRIQVELTSQPAYAQKTPTDVGDPMTALAGKVAGLTIRDGSASRTLLSTSVTIPIGRTVVLGSTQPGGQGEALILVVRPEIRK